MKKGLLVLLALASFAVLAPAQKPAPQKPVVKKTMPMRDPKTGKFVKKGTVPVKTAPVPAKTKKAMPMRDPKTGRFIKKGAPTKTPPIKKP